MRFASLDTIGRSALGTLRRFPITLGMAWLACGFADALALMGGDHPRIMSLMIVATLGIGLSLAFALFAERLGPDTPAALRLGLLAVAPVALAVVASHWLHWSDEVQWRRYFQLSLLGHALVAVLPYTRVREPNGFWQYNRMLFERILIASAFAAVLWGGLAGALAALKPLFGITVSPKAYALLGSWITFIFHPWFFLAVIPKDLSELESRREYPGTLRVFAQFILVPLVVVYQLLLTAYLVKVIATGQWPSGLIGWLVSVEAAAGVLAILLIHPVRDQAGNLWVRTFSRGFYLALLPSIAMLALSIAKRVGQYGVTEDRYFVIVLTAWLAAISILFIVRRDADIRVIPLTLALLAIATIGGPWGAYRISLGSQRAHLIHVLEKNGLWRDGRFQASTQALSAATSKELSSTFTYLIRSHGSDALRPLFGAQVAAADSGYVKPARGSADQRARQLMTRLGLAYVGAWEGPQAPKGSYAFQLPYSEAGEAADVEGQAYHARIDGPGREIHVAGRHLRLAVDEQGHRLVLIEQSTNTSHGLPVWSDTLATTSLDAAIDASQSGHTAGPAPIRLDLTGERARGFLRVTYLAGNDPPAFSLYGLTADLYFTLLGAGRDSTALAP